MVIELDAFLPILSSTSYTESLTVLPKPFRAEQIAIRKLNKHSDLVSALCATTAPFIRPEILQDP